MKKWVTTMLAFGGVLALTACSSAADNEGTGMTPAEILTRAKEVFADARVGVGEDGWTEDQKWLSCGLINEIPHVQLTFTSERRIPLSLEPAEVASRVSDRWAQIGVDAQLSIDEQLNPVRYILSDPPYLSGVNPDGSLTQLWLGADFANFSYTSPCVVGDIFELQPRGGSSSTPTVTPPSSP
ncbi:hypothetical protein [Microbacterium sp. che218]|uniref:hypothetical protein n=1 Tax=Microbacterium sp. che218 TaxID=3140649 RepID=UPI00336BB34B